MHAYMYLHAFYECTGAVIAAGKVVKDQAEADEDLSLKQRAALAGGSALEGTAEALGATLGEEAKPLADTLEVAGKISCV